jgi:hypothetical protein
MKNKNKTYKFSAADVVSYVKDHVEMTNNIVDIIERKVKNINNKTINKITIINNIIKNIGDLVSYVKDNLMIDKATYSGIKDNIFKITDIVNLIIKKILSRIMFLSTLYIFTVPAVFLCKMQIKRIISFIRYTYLKLGLIAMFKIAILAKSFENITFIVENIINIIKLLYNIGLNSFLVTSSLKRSIKFIRMLRVFLLAIFNTFDARRILKVRVLQMYFEILNVISDNLLAISGKLMKLGFKARFALGALKVAIKFLIRLRLFNMRLNNVLKIKFTKLLKIIIKIKMLKYVFDQLISLAVKSIILGVIAVIAIPAMIVDTLFILALAGFIMILKLLLKITKVKFKDLLALILLSVLIGLLVVVAGMVLLLGVIGMKIKWLGILATIGGILLVTILCVALGFAASYILPIIGIAAAGLLSILVIVGLLVMISIAMLILQKIELDVKLIKKNVRTVMDASRAAMSALFETTDKPETEEQDSWVTSLVKGLCKNALMFVQAILSIRVLALTVVAIALITVIAAMLSQLQKISLDSKKIRENVKKVMDVTKMIRELLFSPTKSADNTEENSKESIIKSLISAAGGFLDSYLGIIQTILATPVLLYTMISVGAIWITAGMLSKLQNLTLDEDKIKENIRVVISAAKSVRSIIIEPQSDKEDKEDTSKSSLVNGIIKVVGGIFNAFVNIIGTILSVPILLYTMVSVGIVWMIANMLTKVVEIDLDVNTVIGKIEGVIDCAKSISQKIMHRPEAPKEDTGEKSNWSKLKEFGSNIAGTIGGALQAGLDVVSNIAGAGVLATLLPSIMILGTITNSIKSVSELQIDEKSTTAKVDQIIKIASLVSKQVMDGEGSIPSIDNKKVDNFKDYVDSSIRYFEHMNKLDVTKIKSIGDMYEKMGQFMDKLQDAPIDEIADALVNKISPALSSINDNLGGTNSNTTQNQSAPGTTIINNQQPNKSVDYTSMLENIEDLLEQIKKKLNNNPQPAF